MATHQKSHIRQTRRVLSCPDAKVGYASKKVALQAAAEAVAHDTILNPYKCPHCKCWHLTSGETIDYPRHTYATFLYRGHVLTREGEYWTTPAIPYRLFEVMDLKKEINKLVDNK